VHSSFQVYETATARLVGEGLLHIGREYAHAMHLWPVARDRVVLMAATEQITRTSCRFARYPVADCSGALLLREGC
jgi:hypothetical protein